MSNDEFDSLFQGGAKTASFPYNAFGTTWGGTVAARRTQHAREYDPSGLNNGELKYYKNSGAPIMEPVITIQTDTRDPQDSYDDGRRNLYVGQKMMDAIKLALSNSGAKTVEVGGTLTVTYTHNGEPDPKNPALSPPKLFQATYVPPVSGGADPFAGAVGNLQAGMGAQPVQPAAAPPVQAPVSHQPPVQQPAPQLAKPVQYVQAPPAQPTPAVSAEEIAQMRSFGFSEQQIADAIKQKSSV